MPCQSCTILQYLQVHGHTTIKCPDRDTWHYRKPEFIEQLIPTSILSHYKIDSLTRITSDVKEHIPYIHGDPVIEIPDDEKGKNIRATLASHNLPCSSKKEDKRILEEFATMIGKKIEYTESSTKRIIKTKAKGKA